MMDFSAEQPSPSQTPTSTASDGAHRAPLEKNNTPIVIGSIISERKFKLKLLSTFNKIKDNRHFLCILC